MNSIYTYYIIATEREYVMINFLFVIIFNFYKAPFVITEMRKRAHHPEKYTVHQRYSLVHKVIFWMNKTGKFKTIAYGQENLPEKGGYIMYPNHQGKYDVLGIIFTHKRPCSFVMDKFKSHTVLVREFIDLVQGKRLEKNNPRQGLQIINEVSDEVSKGTPYILFPEGGYQFNNKNKLGEFKAGSFKIALKSKAPIVPVALFDSYKVFNSFHVGPTTTYIYYLPPIYYDEYKDLKTREIADLVKSRIEEKIEWFKEEQKSGSLEK